MTNPRSPRVDAWLLAAIFNAHRGEDAATLMNVIAWGDLLNHAIFDPEELESGLAQLAPAGLITNNEWVFAPAGDALGWYKSFLESRPKPLDLIKQLEAQLSTYRRDALVSNDLSYPSFTAELYEKAVEEYRRWFNEQLQQFGGANH